MLVPYMLGIDSRFKRWLFKLLSYSFPGCIMQVDLSYKNESNISTSRGSCEDLTIYVECVE